jgi:hypothetical protein
MNHSELRTAYERQCGFVCEYLFTPLYDELISQKVMY